MAATTFTWYPDVGARETVKPDVQATRYGDGYENRVANGINTKRPTWSVKFTRLSAESEQILTFLEARAGIEAFNWTSPRNVLGVYICRSWSQTRMKQGVMEISADFERIFE